MIAPDGQIYTAGMLGNDGVPRLVPHNIPGTYAIKYWHFRNCPLEIAGIPAVELCSSYIDLLNKITGEFISKFGRVK